MHQSIFVHTGMANKTCTIIGRTDELSAYTLSVFSTFCIKYRTRTRNVYLQNHTIKVMYSTSIDYLTWRMKTTEGKNTILWIFLKRSPLNHHILVLQRSIRMCVWNSPSIYVNRRSITAEVSTNRPTKLLKQIKTTIFTRYFSHPFVTVTSNLRVISVSSDAR